MLSFVLNAVKILSLAFYRISQVFMKFMLSRVIMRKEILFAIKNFLQRTHLNLRQC